MKSRKIVLLLFLLILSITTILNALYIFGLIGDLSVKVGFIVVMLSTIYLNTKNMVKDNQNNVLKDVEVLFETRLKIKIIRLLFVGLMLIWIATYTITIFLK